MMPASRTTAAARGQRQPTWEVVEAIAADALDAGRPICSLDTLEATAAALSDAGMARTTNVVGRLMELAAWFHDATGAQRVLFRCHTPALVGLFVAAGWSQMDTADTLAAGCWTHAEARAAIEARRGVDLNAEAHRVLARVNGALIDADRVRRAAWSSDDVLDVHAQAAVAIFDRLLESDTDRELRLLIESGGWLVREPRNDDPAAPLTEPEWVALLAQADAEHGD